MCHRPGRGHGYRFALPGERCGLAVDQCRRSSACLPVSADCGFADPGAEVVVSGVLGECVGDVLVRVLVFAADPRGEPHACGGGVFGVAVVKVRENGVDLAAVHGWGEGGETHSASSSMGAYVMRARRFKASPFVETINLGIEKPLPFTGAAVVVLFAPGGLLAPAEGISVPFVARVRGSTPLGVVVGRVDTGRVLLVKNPRRAPVEGVTRSGETTDRRRIVKRGHDASQGVTRRRVR